MSANRTLAPERLLKELRILAILDAADEIGVTRLPVDALHTIAYFADALAPVWGLPILDGQILKRQRPYYPSVQLDLDHLVGLGILMVDDVHYVGGGSESWHVEARYSLNKELAERILSVAANYSSPSDELKFVKEVVFATSGLGLKGLDVAAGADATYSDPLVDVGGMIEVERDDGLNETATIARRFNSLIGQEVALSGAEMINLYVRQLYSRMSVA